MERVETCRRDLQRASKLKRGAIAGIAARAGIPRQSVFSFISGQSACPRFDRFVRMEQATADWYAEWEARQQAQPDAGYGAASGKWAGGEPDSKPDGGRETA